jgi:hypothetical protein
VEIRSAPGAYIRSNAEGFTNRPAVLFQKFKLLERRKFPAQD